MPLAHHLAAVIRRSVQVKRSARTLQLSGLFDLPHAEKPEQVWDVKLDLPEKWHVGLITGPSGCGKSTIARHFWPERSVRDWPWPDGASIVDGFPAALGIKDITGLLCSVGFSSPPSWLKPYAALSTGEQFRVNVARTLAECPDLAVIDEFTSVVDRDVAKIASAAVQKAVRRRDQQLIAVSCHHDIAEWLEPDWIYQPQTGEFSAGRLLRRPSIQMEVLRADRRAWPLFAPHHYLSGQLARAAACYLALVWGRPAAFCAVLSFPHPISPAWREHRTVCLPDFQGVGIGSALGEFVASIYAGTGKRYISTTSNPAYVNHRLRSPLWKCLRRPSLNTPNRGRHAGRVATGMTATIATARLTAGFEYVGPANPVDARKFGLI